MKITAVAALLGVSALACVSGSWPQWTEELVSSLDCGMSISEVQTLAGRDLEPVRSVAFRGVYSTHTIDKGDTSVWLHFDEGQLQAVSRWRPEAWKLKSVYISPKRNLCNGELSFFVRLFRPAALEDPTVYLDGKEVENFPWAGPYEVSSGAHKLRIVEEGYEPIVKRLDFAEGDRGELWIEITGDDLHPLPKESAGYSRSS